MLPQPLVASFFLPGPNILAMNPTTSQITVNSTRSPRFFTQPSVSHLQIQLEPEGRTGDFKKMLSNRLMGSVRLTGGMGGLIPDLNKNSGCFGT